MIEYLKTLREFLKTFRAAWKAGEREFTIMPKQEYLKEYRDRWMYAQEKNLACKCVEDMIVECERGRACEYCMDHEECRLQEKGTYACPEWCLRDLTAKEMESCPVQIKE